MSEGERPVETPEDFFRSLSLEQLNRMKENGVNDPMQVEANKVRDRVIAEKQAAQQSLRQPNSSTDRNASTPFRNAPTSSRLGAFAKQK